MCDTQFGNSNLDIDELSKNQFKKTVSQDTVHDDEFALLYLGDITDEASDYELDR